MICCSLFFILVAKDEKKKEKKEDSEKTVRENIKKSLKEILTTRYKCFYINHVESLLATLICTASASNDSITPNCNIVLLSSVIVLLIAAT